MSLLGKVRVQYALRHSNGPSEILELFQVHSSEEVIWLGQILDSCDLCWKGMEAWHAWYRLHFDRCAMLDGHDTFARIVDRHPELCVWLRDYKVMRRHSSEFGAGERVFINT
jgi:hypothetical protein